jgi:hypothetical protein
LAVLLAIYALFLLSERKIPLPIWLAAAFVFYAGWDLVLEQGRKRATSMALQSVILLAGAAGSVTGLLMRAEARRTGGFMWELSAALGGILAAIGLVFLACALIALVALGRARLDDQSPKT